MNRRELMLMLGGAAAWPFTGHAQQPEPVRRIGVLMPFSENDPLIESYVTTLARALGRLGWVEGKLLAADLSALDEVRRLAGAVKTTVDRLDVLISNAGTAPLVRVRPAPRGSSWALRSITSRVFCSRCCCCHLSRTAHRRGS